MVDSEYTNRLRSVSDDIIGYRNQSGNTAITVMFGVLSLLKAKNKITDKDLDIIFEVENSGMDNTLDDYFSKNYGESDFEIQNEYELEQVRKYCHDYVESMKKYVISAANEINPPKQSTSKKSTKKTTNKKESENEV